MAGGVNIPAFAPEQWRALSPYLDQALEIPPEKRAAWLETFKEENPSLAMELQAVLKEDDALSDKEFLKTGAAAQPSPTPLIGQTVGAYTLESPIGRGGMGTVWLARRSDGRSQGRAAVKFLNVAFLGGAGEERFKREGSILARLSHPNIAHLIDAGVTAAGQGQSRPRKQQFQYAVEHLESALGPDHAETRAAGELARGDITAL